MKILYGVVGEGMGHATRSRVVLDHLLERGHDVRVVVSGKAHRFLVECFAGRAGISIEEIQGLHLDYEGNALDLAETIRRNLERAASRLARNVEVYRKVVEDEFRPDLVVSDFESWAFLYGRVHRIPVVSIDNMQVINRCRHDDRITGQRGFPFQLAKAAVKFKLPGAYHYLVTSFFFPPVRKPRTTLVGPILRPEILAARRDPGEHVLVYLRAAALDELVGVLRRMPGRFRVYGMGTEGAGGNVELLGFSQTGFVEDLRTARAVLAGGGYSLLGEAVHLRVPTLAIPIEGQYEQEINARYLEALGYGAWAPRLEPDVLAGFLERADAHAAALERFEPAGNERLLDLVDELVRRAAAGEPPPVRLTGASMGGFEDDLDPEGEGPSAGGE